MPKSISPFALLHKHHQSQENISQSKHFKANLTTKTEAVETNKPNTLQESMQAKPIEPVRRVVPQQKTLAEQVEILQKYVHQSLWNNYGYDFSSQDLVSYWADSELNKMIMDIYTASTYLNDLRNKTEVVQFTPANDEFDKITMQIISDYYLALHHNRLESIKYLDIALDLFTLAFVRTLQYSQQTDMLHVFCPFFDLVPVQSKTVDIGIDDLLTKYFNNDQAQFEAYKTYLLAYYSFQPLTMFNPSSDIKVAAKDLKFMHDPEPITLLQKNTVLPFAGGPVQLVIPKNYNLHGYAHLELLYGDEVLNKDIAIDLTRIVPDKDKLVITLIYDVRAEGMNFLFTYNGLSAADGKPAILKKELAILGQVGVPANISAPTYTLNSENLHDFYLTLQQLEDSHPSPVLKTLASVAKTFWDENKLTELLILRDSLHFVAAFNNALEKLNKADVQDDLLPVQPITFDMIKTDINNDEDKDEQDAKLMQEDLTTINIQRLPVTQQQILEHHKRALNNYRFKTGQDKEE